MATARAGEYARIWVRRITPLASAVAALLLAFSSPRSEDTLDVALRYLTLHGVPCVSVMQVTTSEDMVVRCHDGREWALFFLEGEVAFIQPETREPYRWQREVYATHPNVYGTDKNLDVDELLVGQNP